jgi:hypothetical protein
MNDTALKKGVQVERKLLQYCGLMKKHGISPGDVGHWVVSPPQELAKHLNRRGGSSHVDDSMYAYGAAACVTIFHPWRQKETE